MNEPGTKRERTGNMEQSVNKTATQHGTKRDHNENMVYGT